jgi:hypothetical protein
VLVADVKEVYPRIFLAKKLETVGDEGLRKRPWLFITDIALRSLSKNCIVPPVPPGINCTEPPVVGVDYLDHL